MNSHAKSSTALADLSDAIDLAKHGPLPTKAPLRGTALPIAGMPKSSLLQSASIRPKMTSVCVNNGRFLAKIARIGVICVVFGGDVRRWLWQISGDPEPRHKGRAHDDS